MNRFFGILILSISQFSVWGQNDERATLHLVARAEENSILLRIAPGSPALWELGNKYGYIVERFTVTRDKQYLGNRERVVLTPQPLKPLPLARWETLLLNNPFAEIAAEAIYGETFELSTNFGQDIMQVYNKAKELESRYSFALFSADLSQEVSEASGLYLKDTDVRKNERYLYRVYSAIPQTLIKSDTGFVYLGLADYAPLPEIRDVKAQFSDHLAVISWSTQYARSFYTAYWIERSEDGKNFTRTSELPYVNTFSDDKPDPGKGYKLDSLKENNKTYHYRVLGISPFGITGPPSEVVKGEGTEALGVAAAIRKITLINTETNVMWEFPKEKESAVVGFEVERSAQHDKNFKAISPVLSPATRTFRDIKPGSTNYYRIKALGKNGTRSLSFPMLYQLEDSIPPLPPAGLAGSVDTTGLVTLRWTANQEEDVSGYRVFRSNFLNAEFAQITREPVTEAKFTEKIPLQNLSRAIYYKIQAVDTRFNPSSYSTVVKLLKPDVLPPAIPVFKTWRADKDKLELTFVPSASRDVACHNLKLKSMAATSWTVAKKFMTLDKPEHIFENLQKSDYQIMVEAVDSSGNISTSRILQVAITGAAGKTVENIKATADRANKRIVLSWKEILPNADKILIYRAEGDGQVNLYKSINGNSAQFSDDSVLVNTTYTYYLKVIYNDRVESAFSKGVKVIF